MGLLKVERDVTSSILAQMQQKRNPLASIQRIDMDGMVV